MREYGNWRKLSLAAVWLCGIMFAGCNGPSDLHDISMPPIITVEQLAADFENYVGREVVLEGRLGISAQDGYYAISQPRTGTSIPPLSGEVNLDFGANEPDSAKMVECLSGVTLVIGVVQESRAISVKEIKLKSEALVHSVVSCYEAALAPN